MRGSVQKYSGTRGVSWCYVIDLGHTPEGKRDQKRKRGFPTRKAAEAAMQRELHERREGTYAEPSKETVGAYLERWLAAADIAPATAYRYEGVIRRHLAPRLGAIPLGKLSTLDVQELYAELGQALAPSTVRHAHAVLHGALKQAMAWQLVARNVADGVVKPTAKPKPVVAWTAEESRRFLSAVSDPDRRVLYRLALDSGMRIGELLALTWADVDLDRGVAGVRRTVTCDRDGRVVVGDRAKRSASHRRIAILPTTVAALRAHRARQNARRLALGPV